MGNFFRKDLNLNKKWWHRMLKVFFFGGIIILPAIVSFDFIDSDLFRMEKVQTMEERLNNGISFPSQLLKKGEYIDSCSGRFTQHNMINNTKDIFKQGACSLNWDVENLRILMKETGLTYRSLKDGRENISSLGQVAEEIKLNKTLCIIKDRVFGNDFLNHEFYQNDLCFVKQTLSSKIIGTLSRGGVFLLNLIAFSLLGGLIMVLYYKVILYIIYGNGK